MQLRDTGKQKNKRVLNACQSTMGHIKLCLSNCGLVVSTTNPWLGASPNRFMYYPDDNILYNDHEKSLAEESNSSDFSFEKDSAVLKQ